MHKDTVLPAHSGLRPPMLVLILKKSSLCSLLIIKVIVILVSVRDLSIIVANPFVLLRAYSETNECDRLKLLSSLHA